MKRRRREERRQAVNDRGLMGPAVIVGKMGSVIEWTAEEGWTRDGDLFTPEDPPLSEDALDLLREGRSKQ